MHRATVAPALSSAADEDWQGIGYSPIAARPRHIVCQGGLDSFNPADRATFFSHCGDYEQSSGITIAQETHRMRPLFTPWAPRDVLEADPSDPRWETQRAWFETRWKTIVTEAAAAGRTELVVVPEYGPAPYLPSEPHTGRPVADLWHVVHRERETLKRVLAKPQGTQLIYRFTSTEVATASPTNRAAVIMCGPDAGRHDLAALSRVASLLSGTTISNAVAAPAATSTRAKPMSRDGASASGSVA